MKNIIENVKLVVSMTVIGLLLLYIGTMVFMPELTIKIFRFQPYVVVTESMEPVINVNDVAVITPFDVDEAEVGDIITFKADIDYNGTLETVTHYIYEIQENDGEITLRTHRHFEDDETVTPDTWIIPASNVIGSYGFKISYFGYIIGFIKSIYGIAVIGLNVLVFTTVKFLNNRSRKEKEELEANDTLKQTQEKVIS